MVLIYTSLIIGFIVALVLVSLIFKNLWRTPSPLRYMTINITVFGFTLVGLLGIIEVFFYAFVVHSDSFSFTLANQRWFERYWHPINTLGYRDPEPNLLADQKVIFVLGDSFVAGQGIEDYEDRFSNRLQKNLGPKWAVFNIAQVGWSTPEEYQALITHPQQPEIIIFSYFIDDIRAAVRQSSLEEQFEFSELVQSPPAILAPLVRHSYFFNFFYWQWYRYHNQQPESIYWQRLQYFYHHDAVWSIHQQQLQALVEYTQQRGQLLLPILFPNLVAIESSQPIIARVKRTLKQFGIEALDLTPYFSQRPADELIVSPIDAHPNEQVHAEVATIVFEALQQRLADAASR